MTGHVPVVALLRRLPREPLRLGSGIALTLMRSRYRFPTGDDIIFARVLTRDYRPNVLTIVLDDVDEGITWCRGWEGEAVDAMLAARALA